MKATYQGDLGDATRSLQQPWKLWPTCMVQNSIPPFSYSHNQSWNTPIPWKPWEPQYHPYLPCPQGWNGPSYDPMATFPHVAAPTNPLYFPPSLQQYPTCTSRSTTQINQLHLLHLPSHLTPPCPTQIHVQPTPHPNHNKAVQYAYSVELQNFPTFPTCSTSPTPLQEDCMLQQTHPREGFKSKNCK
jgi:hypothetical protein